MGTTEGQEAVPAMPGMQQAGMEAVPARERQVAGNHYASMTIQPWDVIEEYGLDFYRGNVLKYLLRADRKGAKLEDLKKARHYLDRVIELEEQRGDQPT